MADRNLIAGSLDPDDMPNLPPIPGAPDWVQHLRQELQRDRHGSRNRDMALDGRLSSIERAVGKVPDSDGHGGTGIAGDVARLRNDVNGLLDLKKVGIGAVGAITMFGVVIVLGVKSWIMNLFAAAK